MKASATTAYTFERHPRDCPANDNAIAAGKEPPFFDFRVMLAGEHVATYFRESIGTRGYRLHDRAGVAIVEPGRAYATHLGALVPKKADFELMLAGVHVPSAAEIAEREQREAAAELARRRAAATADFHTALHCLEAAIRERIELDTVHTGDYSLLHHVEAIKQREAVQQTS